MIFNFNLRNQELGTLNPFRLTQSEGIEAKIVNGSQQNEGNLGNERKISGKSGRVKGDDWIAVGVAAHLHQPPSHAFAGLW